MRDASGEAAHGLHLLRLAQLRLRIAQCRLCPVPQGDVHRDDEPRPIGADTQVLGRDLHVQQLATARQVAGALADHARSLRRPDDAGQALAVFGRPDVEHRHREELLAGIPIAFHCRLVHGEKPEGAHVEDPDGQRQGLEERAVAAFAFGEFDTAPLERGGHAVECLDELAKLTFGVHARAM